MVAFHVLHAVVLFQVAAGSPFVQMEPSTPVHDSTTSSWVKGDRVPGDQSIFLHVAVRVDAEKLAELERVFWEVSNPQSDRYGMHRNIDDVTQILAVPNERVQKISQYFMAAGAHQTLTSPNRDMIRVTMPASVAEAALQTTLHTFSHTEATDLKIVRASHHYYLPAEVAKDVVMVGELLQFPSVPAQNFASPASQGAGQWPNDCTAAGCKGLVTPGVLAQRYKLPNASVANSDANSMAVAEFQGQYYKKTDLQSFSTSCHRDVTVAKDVGGERQSAGVESELDIEYIKAVAPEIPLTVVYNEQYSLLNWANQISSLSDTPQVHSVSYGNDERQQTSREYMLTCNTAFMKAGARGISILFASGDQGVCGREGCGIFKFRFKPDFPAGSPYITSVGGTDFESTPPTIGAESAWVDSGGGFSDDFPIPDFQKDAVAAYKSNPDANLPPQAYWNGSGRGYPDVAALGGTKTSYCVATSGMFQGVAGTSASCPVVAGVIAKLNGLRIAAGRPPLGFLNPFIYQNPSGFQDVTSGINKASRNYGFTAVKGWDAATGWGTPDFEALSHLVMAAGTRSSENLVV